MRPLCGLDKMQISLRDLIKDKNSFDETLNILNAIMDDKELDHVHYTMINVPKDSLRVMTYGFIWDHSTHSDNFMLINGSNEIVYASIPAEFEDELLDALINCGIDWSVYEREQIEVWINFIGGLKNRNLLMITIEGMPVNFMELVGLDFNTLPPLYHTTSALHLPINKISERDLEEFLLNPETHYLIGMPSPDIQSELFQDFQFWFLYNYD